MLDLINWYFSSLGEFWSSAVRIGLPHILLIILLVCWMRKRGCGKGRKSCCSWMWGGRDDSSCDADDCRRRPNACCQRPDDCGCSCGCCRGGADSAPASAHHGGDDDA